MPLRPTRALIALLSLWTLMGLAGSLYPPVSGWWGLLGGVLGFLALFEAVVVLVSKFPLAERILPGRMAVGVEGEVKLRIINLSNRPLYVCVFDGIPSRCECDVFPWRGWIKGSGYLDLNYPITLLQRGEIDFGKTHIMMTSLLGFWSRCVKIGDKGKVKVYPNYQPVLSYALMAMAHRQ